jgi:hypothetical protein
MPTEQKPPCGICNHVYHDGLCRAMKRDVAGEYECGCVDYFAPLEEEAWIRDLSARTVAFKAGPEQIAALCEGERQFCPICGAAAPLWPMKEWAQHALDVHAAEITYQQASFFTELTKAAMTQQSMGLLQAHFISRISLRRRARDLGLVTFLDERGGPRIVQAGPGRAN